MTVVLAEDSVLLREGLVRLLGESGFEVLTAVGSAEELLLAVEQCSPHLVLTDVRMPPGHSDEGLRAALEIRQNWPAIGILVLSQYVELSYARDLLSTAASSGGIGYLLKDRVTDVDELADAVNRIHSGGTVLDPEVIAALFNNNRSRSGVEALTERERQVMALIAEGRSNAAIGQHLTLSAGAVEKHISSIFSKLDLPPSSEDHRRVLAVLSWLRQ
ncbi:response regulator [Psychromicrobium sp. YIM B11713]|uniref:response regulator transcription factor n=1 Tax=Psychromicrobium sp. YIM B11713 TaxID=3145233 RepID=UPI00374ED3CD